RCVQEESLQCEHPRQQRHLCQDDEKDGGNLADRVDLAEYAGTEVAKTNRRVQNHGGGDNAHVAAEHQDGVFPGDFLHEGQHEEQRAEEQFVREWIKVLPKKSLLVQCARQHAVESITQSRSDQKAERPGPVPVENRNNDEWNKNQAQKGDLVRSRQEL